MWIFGCLVRLIKAIAQGHDDVGQYTLRFFFKFSCLNSVAYTLYFRQGGGREVGWWSTPNYIAQPIHIQSLLI